jgi:hypothetical protein
VCTLWRKQNPLVSPGNRTLFSTSWPGLFTGGGNQVSCHSSVVSHCPFLSEAQVQSPTTLCTMCGEQSGTRISVYPNPLLFLSQHHFSNGPFSFIHLLMTLGLYHLISCRCQYTVTGCFKAAFQSVVRGKSSTSARRGCGIIIFKYNCKDVNHIGKHFWMHINEKSVKYL